MNFNYSNITVRQIPEVDDLDVYVQMARLCFSISIIIWVMGHAMNCCISPFADSICLKMKEYERKLDEADDIMCEYENQIEVLKSQIKELNEQHDECRKLKRSRID